MSRPLFSAAALSAIKLKPAAEQMRDNSAPKFVAAFDTVESRIDYINIWYDANIEHWIQLLGAETFTTRFLNLEIEDAEAIIHAYEQQCMSKPPKPIDELHAQRLRDMEKRLESVMNEVKSLRVQAGQSAVPDACAFVKTSCRSPKDTVLFNTTFKQGIIDALHSQTHAFGRAVTEATENDQLTALFAASIDCLKSHDAAEVINMFTTSERVWTDLKNTLEFKEARGWKQNFVVRQWFDIESDMEFRGFVKRGKLNAVSQYNYLFRSPRLVAARSLISDGLQLYFTQRVQPLLGQLLDEQGYVIDFAICGKMRPDEMLQVQHPAELLDRIKVIELNPFASTTDGALFSWEKELPLLSGESDEFEFRIREIESSGMKAGLIDTFRTLLEKAVREVRLEAAGQASAASESSSSS